MTAAVKYLESCPTVIACYYKRQAIKVVQITKYAWSILMKEQPVYVVGLLGLKSHLCIAEVSSLPCAYKRGTSMTSPMLRIITQCVILYC